MKQINLNSIHTENGSNSYFKFKFHPLKFVLLEFRQNYDRNESKLLNKNKLRPCMHAC